MAFKYGKCPPNASIEDTRMLFDTMLDDAMDQMVGKGYGTKYRGSGKTVYQAAFAFLGRDDIDLRVCQ